MIAWIAQDLAALVALSLFVGAILNIAAALS